ncbi:hypothetical protein AGMMS50212_10990 [Spirochaetia bacterium]|nr:hypothetical protein AGMMS50212_10990 [Spirochaetia bacterium]
MFSVGAQTAQSEFTGVVPQVLVRPILEENPIYPFDSVIGTLSKGAVSDTQFRFAQDVLQDVLIKAVKSVRFANLPSSVVDDLMKNVVEVAPEKFRLGGGKEEVDGSISFLFRLVGKELNAAGELYIRSGDDNKWILEDFIIEDPSPVNSGSKIHDYNYSPYERFY